MDEAEKHQVDGGEQGPAAGERALVSARESSSNITPAPSPTSLVAQHQHGEHQNGGDDDLVGGDGDDIGQQDHAVETKEEAQRDRGS